MTRQTRRGDPAAEFDSALEVLDGEQLRGILRDALAALDERPRARLMDTVVARAARRGSGWKLSRARRDVERFVEAARVAGAADPSQVDDLLRQASRAFLTGDVSTARAVFRDLLTPIANGDIDLGQFDMLEDVLTVDLEISAAQYVVSVYLTTPPRQRPAAVFAALDEMAAVAPLDQPVAAMERHATEPLAEFERFQPQWLRFVERHARSRSAWESPWSGPAVWAREAAVRLEGTAGLERLAKSVRHPEAYDAWCAALVDDARWEEAQRAFTTAAAHAGTDTIWRGEFLDGAALAAQEVAAKPMAGVLEAAWRGAPCAARLAGWLGADGPSPTTIRKRARAALRGRPRPAGRQLALLHIVTGRLRAAAARLTRAPGLGWSAEDHPGHVTFPAVATLLAASGRRRLSAPLHNALQEAPYRGRPDSWWEDGDPFEDSSGGPETARVPARPRLRRATAMEIVEDMSPVLHVPAGDRAAVLRGMRAAASKRVEAILDGKHRRHYAHAAALIAASVAVAPAAGREEAATTDRWAEELRTRYARFTAFQAELRRFQPSGGRLKPH